MRWIGRLILIVLGNAAALWLANKYVPGFVLHADIVQLLIIAVVLALLNAVLKPIFAVILSPIIIITLGLGVIIVNTIILYLLPIVANNIDILRGSIMIQSITALELTTLIVSAINFVIHLIS